MNNDKLLAFFRNEFHAEEAAGFARLKRMPDSRVEESLAWYQSLSAADRASFVDCAAHYAAANYGFVLVTERPTMAALLRSGDLRGVQAVMEAILAERIDHTKHPFLERWADPFSRFPFRTGRNVMLLRDMVRTDTSREAGERRRTASRTAAARSRDEASSGGASERASRDEASGSPASLSRSSDTASR